MQSWFVSPQGLVIVNASEEPVAEFSLSEAVQLANAINQVQSSKLRTMLMNSELDEQTYEMLRLKGMI